MINFRNSFLSDFFSNSKRSIDHENLEVTVIGNKYEETKDIKCSSLKFFVERDIFIAIKNKTIPQIKFEVEVNNNQMKVHYIFSNLQNNAVTKSEVNVMLEIAKMFMAYNKEVYRFKNGQMILSRRRIDYNINHFSTTKK